MDSADATLGPPEIVGDTDPIDPSPLPPETNGLNADAPLAVASPLGIAVDATAGATTLPAAPAPNVGDAANIPPRGANADTPPAVDKAVGRVARAVPAVIPVATAGAAAATVAATAVVAATAGTATAAVAAAAGAAAAIIAGNAANRGRNASGFPVSGFVVNGPNIDWSPSSSTGLMCISIESP